jgi:hypothetical protein
MSTGANDEQNLKSTPRVGLVQDLSDLPVLRPRRLPAPLPRHTQGRGFES